MAKNKSGRLVTLAWTATLAVVFGLFNCQQASAADSSDAAKQISTETANHSSEPASKDALSAKDTTDGAHCHIKQETYKKVSCDNPHAACAESERVIETLKLMSHLYTEGKFEEYSKYIDTDATTFDEK